MRRVGSSRCSAGSCTDGAEAGHAAHTREREWVAADSPAGGGLFESAADQVLAGTFDLAAADRTSLA